MEFVKPFFILIVARIISSDRIKSLNSSHLISFVLLSLITGLLLLQPDIGQTVLLISTWMSLIFISGFNVLFLLLIFTIIVVLFFAMLNIAPEKFNYIITRITSFVEPEKSGNFQSQKAI